MVSFSCSVCGDVVKKPKVLSHATYCRTQSFTCVDCTHTFDLEAVKSHSSCVTEVQKYQGKWREKQANARKAPPQRKKTASDSDDDAGGSAKRTVDSLGRPLIRKKMNLSSSDDDDDDDWVTSRPRAPASANATTGRASGKPATPPASTPPQEARTTLEKRKRGMSPHQLPRAVQRGDCTVPSFVLGGAEEVATIVEDILREDLHANSASEKDIAKHLVTRYQRRIANSVRLALQAAVEFGTLTRNADGSISRSRP